MNHVLDVCFWVAILVTILSMWRTSRKRRRIERAFFARGYVYVEVHLRDGSVVKGFMPNGLMRAFYKDHVPMRIRLDSYTTRESAVINDYQIEWIKQIKPKL